MSTAEEVLVDRLDAEKVDDARQEEEDHEQLFETLQLSFYAVCARSISNRDDLRCTLLLTKCSSGLLRVSKDARSPRFGAAMSPNKSAVRFRLRPSEFGIVPMSFLILP